MKIRFDRVLSTEANSQQPTYLNLSLEKMSKFKFYLN